MQEKRYFTVEEANECIPELITDISALLELKEELEKLHAELTPFLEVIPSNGGGKNALLLMQTGDQFREIVERIQHRGCHLKGLDPALIDFPHMRDGKEVYLCWRYGEREIRYWHEIESGFAGRKPL
ncbi:DUF2203 domain-containing protein [Candidatus Poribacteria bacterium]|nr:MAG: DUF2203 domain-containing protein [Candidatus Poribacteria bacterium]